MSQGIFIDGRRPKSKKEIKEVAQLDPARVEIERTSLYGGSEYDGLATGLPEGKTVYFAGPDPYTSRKFYGQITRKGGEVKVK